MTDASPSAKLRDLEYPIIFAWLLTDGASSRKNAAYRHPVQNIEPNGSLKLPSTASIIHASFLLSDNKVIFSMVGVGKRYQSTNKQVLRDIYLSFFHGAKIGVLGLNGSGKSTLLRIIAGLDFAPLIHQPFYQRVFPSRNKDARDTLFRRKRSDLQPTSCAASSVFRRRSHGDLPLLEAAPARGCTSCC